MAHASSLDIVGDASPPKGRTAPPPSGTSRDLRHAGGDGAETLNEASPADRALEILESTVVESPLWPGALGVWKRFLRSERVSKPQEGRKEGDVCPEGQEGKIVTLGSATELGLDHPDISALKFRASVVRDGRHAFNSMDASPRLGAAVWTANPGWTVDLKVGREIREGFEGFNKHVVFPSWVTTAIAVDGRGRWEARMMARR